MKTIAQCKKGRFFPISRQEVKTKIKSNTDFVSMIKDKYISSRVSGAGTYIDFVAGSGGDWWWIKHQDDSIGVYLAKEVFDR